MLLDKTRVRKRPSGLCVSVPKAWLLEYDIKPGDTIFANGSLDGEIRYSHLVQRGRIRVKLRTESGAPVLTIPSSLVVMSGLTAGTPVDVSVDMNRQQLVIREDT